MKAIDERAAMWRVIPRTVEALFSADIRVEFPHLLFDALSLMPRRIWQEKRIRVHRVGHGVDHCSVSKWSIGCGQCFLVFLHHLYVVVEESEDALDDGLEAHVLRNLRKTDERFQSIRRDDGEGSTAIVNQVATHGVGKPKSPTVTAVPAAAIGQQPLEMP